MFEFHTKGKIIDDKDTINFRMLWDFEGGDFIYELLQSITNYELRITTVNYELRITNYGHNSQLITHQHIITSAHHHIIIPHSLILKFANSQICSFANSQILKFILHSSLFIFNSRLPTPDSRLMYTNMNRKKMGKYLYRPLMKAQITMMEKNMNTNPFSMIILRLSAKMR
jgi:hypothetical protein